LPGLVLVVASFGLGYDLRRPADEQATARSLIGGIHLYQAALSPLLSRSGVRCRFSPSCSHYAEASIEKHGAAAGLGRSIWRVLRCGPWTPAGTVDPP